MTGDPTTGGCGREGLGAVLDDQPRSRWRPSETVPVPPLRHIAAPRLRTNDGMQGSRNLLRVDPPQEGGRACQDQRLLEKQGGLQPRPQAHAVPDAAVDFIRREIDRMGRRRDRQLHVRMSRLKPGKAR